MSPASQGWVFQQTRICGGFGKKVDSTLFMRISLEMGSSMTTC
jgi:hypothetical protein